MARWKDWEVDYLSKNFQSLTDKEMASFLNRSEESVMQKRRKMRFSKKASNAQESIEAAVEAHNDTRTNTALQDLTESQRRAELSNILTNSPIWGECKEMFSSSECTLYKARWVEFRMTYDSLNPVELDTLHILLTAMLRLNGYQKMERRIKDSHTGTVEEMRMALITVHKEIREMNEVYMKALNVLSASRDQRIKREGDQKVTLLTLLRELELKEGREQMAKESDALRFISNLERERLSAEGFLKGEGHEV
jgi:hypothetical protein